MSIQHCFLTIEDEGITAISIHEDNGVVVFTDGTIAGHRAAEESLRATLAEVIATRGEMELEKEAWITEEAEALATVKTTLATKYNHGFQPAETVVEHPETIDLNQVGVGGPAPEEEEDRCNDCGGDGIACGGCEFQRP